MFPEFVSTGAFDKGHSFVSGSNQAITRAVVEKKALL